MNTIKYTTIENVLYDLTTAVDEMSWDDNAMRYWAIKAAKKMAPEAMYPTYVKQTTLSSHKSIMPSDFVYLNGIMLKTYDQASDSLLSRQVGYRNSTDSIDGLDYQGNDLLPYAAWIAAQKSNAWIPLKATSSIYMDSILCTDDYYLCPECQYEFNVSSTGVITSTAKEGDLLISYKGFPRDTDGKLLIPDDEDFKEAVFSFVLYRYFLKKVNGGKNEFRQQRDYYKREFHRASMKAKNLNSPDLPMMEKIKNEASRLVRPSYKYDHGFANLGYKENITY